MEPLRSLSKPSVPVRVLATVLLAGAVAVAYGPAVQGDFVWDDDAYVEKQPTLRSLDGLRRIWLEPGATPQYYPLVFTTFWIEYRLWELDPRGYHVTNITVHLLTALLLGRVLSRLGVPGAHFTAALFALHPVHVESVAWITERKNVLSAFFYLLSAGAYLRWALPAGDPAAPPGRPRDWILSLVLFAAALLSKTVTCALPAALLLVIAWKRGRVRRRDVRALAPFFGIGVALAGVTFWVEHRVVGTHLIDLGISWPERFLLAGKILWFYLQKLAWPHPLIFIYPRWEIDASRPEQFVPLLAAVGVIAVLVRQRRRLGGGPLLAALFFAGTLVPALGFVDVLPMRYSWVADHFQYLASIGPLAGGVALVVHGVRWVEARRPLGGMIAGSVVGGAVLVVLSVLTWRQCHVYRDLETLWRATLARNENATIAHINLGNLLSERGENDAAILHYRRVFEVEPPEQDTILLARAHFNIGNQFLRKREPAKALAEYDEALAADGRYVNAHHGRGVALVRLRRLDEAARAFERALELDPGHRDARRGLAWVRARMGERR